MGGALGHLGQTGQLQNFADLEYVQGEQLLSGKPEQQYFQTVFANQAGSLINGIQNSGHDEPHWWDGDSIFLAVYPLSTATVISEPQ